MFLLFSLQNCVFLSKSLLERQKPHSFILSFLFCLVFLQQEGGSASPLMELPPLSPGVQVTVIDVMVVLVTVRRGWSGGTEDDIYTVRNAA